MKIGLLVSLLAVPLAGRAAPVLTQHNDNARSGAVLDESALTPATVNAQRFGLIARYPVDGQIYAQPLYVAHGAQNLVLVATEHDSLFAFDAASGALQFTSTFGTPVPSSEYPGCSDLQPEIGITSTPAVDDAAGIVYLVAKTFDAGHALTLHAVSLDTGLDVGSAVIAAAGFDAKKQLQRAGLLLKDGIVYIAFGSHCDIEPYHGWVMAYDATTLAQLGVFNTTPDTRAGGIWMSGQGPAADDTGLYVSTGNGTFAQDGRNFGDSALKLNFTDASLLDSFTPHDQAKLDPADDDFGSGGVMLIPNTSLAVTGGKNGVLYLLDGANGMGGFNPVDDSLALQNFFAGGSIFGSPVFWNNQLYIWPNGSTLNGFLFDGAQFGTTPFSKSTMAAGGFPGGVISLSANGNQNGIVWANLPLARGGQATTPGLLRAFDANDLSRELWNSKQNAARDDFGNYAKFCAPTIANGRVYQATFSNFLAVYGLL